MTDKTINPLRQRMTLPHARRPAFAGATSLRPPSGLREGGSPGFAQAGAGFHPPQRRLLRRPSFARRSGLREGGSSHFGCEGRERRCCGGRAFARRRAAARRRVAKAGRGHEDPRFHAEHAARIHLRGEGSHGHSGPLAGPGGCGGPGRRHHLHVRSSGASATRAPIDDARPSPDPEKPTARALPTPTSP